MPTAAVHSALSLSGKVQEYGGWAGFAAVLGLGVLSMLYFAPPIPLLPAQLPPAVLLATIVLVSAVPFVAEL